MGEAAGSAPLPHAACGRAADSLPPRPSRLLSLTMSAQTAGATPSTSAPTPVFILSNLLICSFLWGSAFLFVKLSGDLNPFVMASMRGVIGGTSLSAWFLLQGKS